MQRKIKFRGKRLDNGEWVYGYYVYYGLIDNQKHYIVPDYASTLYAFEVDPSTVGQFTGLKDKNGIEIYEGDFISAYNGRIKGPVIFNKRGLAFGIPNGPNEIYQFSMNFLESKDIEVIGNIYENPELLTA